MTLHFFSFCSPPRRRSVDCLLSRVMLGRQGRQGMPVVEVATSSEGGGGGAEQGRTGAVVREVRAGAAGVIGLSLNLSIVECTMAEMAFTVLMVCLWSSACH